MKLYIGDANLSYVRMQREEAAMLLQEAGALLGKSRQLENMVMEVFHSVALDNGLEPKDTFIDPVSGFIYTPDEPRVKAKFAGSKEESLDRAKQLDDILKMIN